jgi:regulator of protease activity HflC (stomatin/prohibitin superfamily)
VAHRLASSILVEERHEIEEESARILQEELDRIRSGVAIVSVNLHELHAPPEVHFAYRDVASALEDQEQYLHQAEGTCAEQMATAEADAYEKIQESETYGRTETDEASGKASAFLRVLEAYENHRKMTRLRLYLEAVEAALRSTRNVILLGDDIEIDMYRMKSKASGEIKVFPPAENRRESQTSPLLRSPMDR